ncbi:MAG: DNA-binding protein [Candidatus Competibacteraceae bacterium]|nr:DNA-binding protein [Candidatus Competibacteraceae bacterium]
MARSGIHYEEVKSVAETLLGRGLHPTIQRVREQLGTGSNTTISEHLKHWQRDMAETPKAILPPNIPDAVMTALDSFWKIAVQYAEAAFEEQRAVAVQAVAEAEQSRDAALVAQRQAQAEANELRQHLDTAQTTAHDLANRLMMEQERRTVAETAIDAAEQRVQAATETVVHIRAETEARVEQLEAALQQTRADSEQQLAQAQHRFNDERQRGEANEARLMQLLDRDRTDHAAERQVFANERDDWKNQAKIWQARLDAQQRENTDAHTALATAEERQRGLDGEIRQLRVAFQAVENKHLDLLLAAEVLRGELKAALDEQQHLRQRLEHQRQVAAERQIPPNAD